jgi:ferric-dicitrate binding protein FerR (iron transport regulator)
MTIPPPGDTDRLPQDEELFRYLVGALPDHEAARVRAWLNAAGVADGTIAGLRDALQADALARGGVEREMAAAMQASLRQLMARIDRESALPERRASLVRSSVWRWGSAALLSVSVAVLGIVAIRFRAAMRSEPARVYRHVYATVRGERATLTLDDGSRVMLAPQTTLQVMRAFGERTRTVTLRGEAYFDVASDVTTPFVVQTGLVATRVLGTTFDVRHYDGDANTRVSVTSGRVSLGALAESVIAPAAHVLSAGMLGVATDSTVVVHASADAVPTTTWTNDVLVFRHVPAAEVLATLSRWYDYDFRVVDSAAMAQSITAQFSMQSSREALATLRLVFGVDLAVDGKVVTLLVPKRTSHMLRNGEFVAPMDREPRHTLTTEVGR